MTIEEFLLLFYIGTMMCAMSHCYYYTKDSGLTVFAGVFAPLYIYLYIFER
jgi:hypothetical protein